jgi:hypothetical protein
MWVIVAVTLGLSGTPKLTLLPGPEFPTEADCVKATRVHANYDSQDAQGGSIAFSFCVPKGSVQIGQASPEPSKPDEGK